MAGFYVVSRNDQKRVITLRRVADNTGGAVYLDDAAEAALPAPTGTMPFADLTTWAAAVKDLSTYQVPYDADKGPSLITVVGQTQYSADGSTWANTIPDGVMVAGSPVEFYIRTNPAGLTRADDGTYTYNFLMQTVGSGGISLINIGRNLAKVAGTTPLDQVGQTFSVNCTVVDGSAHSVTGTALTKVWE